ncbi:MAG TPA: tetratricopeptide repeat protein [Thermoanaerobaculia bacterium]|nr:tetratricopeptide repeat protein [Thermoanaerobaculia bacterium]
MMVHKRTLWISGLALACIAAAVAVALAAVPPNLGKAIEEQRRLLAERPQDPGVYNDLGNLLVLASRPDEAEEAYRKAVELAPDKVAALFNLALLQQQRGELRESLRLFKEVLDLQPQHAWAWYQTGTLYEHWGQNGRAVEAYAQAFRIDPQLAFPETNPHVVENGLLTQAMLRAYQEGDNAPTAPAMYEEPGRIVGLLVPRPAHQPQPAGDEEMAAGQARPQPGQPGQPGAATRPGQAAPSSVLRQGDLDGRSTGQATPQGRRPGSRPSSPDSMPRSLRTWERPEPTIEDPGYEVPSEEQPGEVVTPPPGGVYYRPGLSSTGRLDLQVVPDRRTSRPREGRG